MVDPNPYEAFGRTGQNPYEAFGRAGDPKGSSSAFDDFFKGTGAGRILSAFGQGAENAWGSEPLGLSAATEKALKDYGFNADEHLHGPLDVLSRGFHDTFIRPSAIALDIGMRSLAAPFGAYQRGVEQIGKEVGQEQLSRDIAAAPEAFAGMIGSLGPPGAVVAGGVGALSRFARRVPERETIEQARDLKIVGPNEEPPPMAKAEAAATETLRTPAQVSDAVREMAAKTEEIQNKSTLKWTGRSYEYTPQRGPLTTGELVDLADDLGLGREAINPGVVRGRFGSPEELDAAKDLVRASAEKLRGLMDEVAAKGDELSQAEADNLVTQSKVHRMLLDHIAGREARPVEEIVREPTAGETGAKPAAAKPELTKEQVVADVGAGIPRPEQVNKYVEKARDLINDEDVKDKTKLGRAIDFLVAWRNTALISGIGTHLQYLYDNLAFMPLRIAETAVGAAFGTGRRALTGSTEGLRNYEVLGQLHALIQGPPDVIRSWGQMWRGEVPINPYVMTRARLPPRLEKVFGAVSKVGFYAAHLIGKTMSERQWMNSTAYRKAAEEGLTGQAAAKRVGELIENPTAEMLSEVNDEAHNTVLLGAGGKWTQAVTNFTRDHPILHFVVPFARISGNVLRQGALERTPLGLFDREILANLAGKNGALAQDKQVGRLLLSTALGGTFVWMKGNDLITGAGPSDPKERAVWLRTHQPYSLNIGGTWYSFARGGVIGTMAGLWADAYDLGKDVGKGNMGKFIGHMVSAAQHGVLSESWLRDVSDWIGALTDVGQGKYPEKFINNFVTSFLPYSSLLNQTAREIDPDLRAARSLLDAVKQKTPILSKSLPVRNDVWGEPIQRFTAPSSLPLPAPVSAIYETPVRDDPVAERLLDVGVYPGMLSSKVHGVALSGDEYSDYTRMVGRLRYQFLSPIVTAPGFQDLPKGAQGEIIHKTLRRAEKLGLNQFLLSHSDVLEKTVRARMEGKWGESQK